MAHRARLIVDGVDVSSATLSAEPLEVRVGRANSSEQPSPNSLVASVITLPRPVTVGMSLALDVDTLDGAGWRRHFTGYVSDAEASLQTYPDGTDATVTKLVAVSAGLGRMVRQRIGDAPWGTELDGARIGRILALCPDVTVGTVDAGTVGLLARDVDSQPALELASRYASEALGCLVDERSGAVSYADANRRDPLAPPVLELDASEVLALPVIAERVGTLINRMGIGYGAADPQAATYAEDLESIERFGLYDQFAGTELADAAGAELITSRVISLYASPRWQTEESVIPLHVLPPARAAELAALEPGALISLRGWPSPTPDPFLVWIEGIHDRITDISWERTLLVSDRWSAPMGPTDPPGEPGSCAAFDWVAECSTLNQFPTISSEVVRLTSVNPAEELAWDTELDWLVMTLDGIQSQALGVLVTDEWQLGSSANTPHPDPWTEGNPYVDFCIGWEIQSLTADGTPTDNPLIVPCQIETGGVFVPGEALILDWGFRWTPADGWQSGEAAWADGDIPPQSVYTPQGCAAHTAAKYQELNPALSRVPTRNGAWTFPVAYLWLAVTNPEDGPVPSFGDVTFDNVRIRWRQRWSRKLA